MARPAAPAAEADRYRCVGSRRWPSAPAVPLPAVASGGPGGRPRRIVIGAWALAAGHARLPCLSALCEAAASAAAATGHHASRQIEQENFRVVQCRNRERGLVSCRRALARPQGLAVERDRAADHLPPALAAGRERVGDLVAAAEERCVDPRVLMDHDRSVAPVGRPDEAKPPALPG